MFFLDDKSGAFTHARTDVIGKINLRKEFTCVNCCDVSEMKTTKRKMVDRRKMDVDSVAVVVVDKEDCVRDLVPNGFVCSIGRQKLRN